jgi:TetR/AcrR family transcriptional regulator, tetracycline repressor protein
MAARTSPDTRERLSRESLALDALRIADIEGIEAVTIRRLAQENSVTPMALYWHFKDKDAVLDGIAEQIYAAVTLPEPSAAPWDKQLRDVLNAVLAAVRPHPLAAELLAPRVMRSEAGLILAERVIGMLRTAGFSASQSSQTAAFLLCSIVTLVTSEPGTQTPLTGEAEDAMYRAKRAQLDSLSPKRFPNLLESARYFLACDDEDAYFANGMNFLVEGTRAVRPV